MLYQKFVWFEDQARLRLHVLGSKININIWGYQLKFNEKTTPTLFI